MNGIGICGYLGILVLICLVGFTVLVVPLFYTVLTRWVFSGGSPITEIPADAFEEGKSGSGDSGKA